MKLTLIWRVSDAPSGKYKSFSKRAWPMALHTNGNPAAAIYCADPYDPKKVATEEHGVLTVMIADWSVTPWKWRKASKECWTLAQAKAEAQRLLEKHIHFVPVKS